MLGAGAACAEIGGFHASISGRAGGLPSYGDAAGGCTCCAKDALDDANNNLTFVQPTPCAFSFAE
jgi:hypothetical protein